MTLPSLRFYSFCIQEEGRGAMPPSALSAGLHGCTLSNEMFLCPSTRTCYSKGSSGHGAAERVHRVRWKRKPQSLGGGLHCQILFFEDRQRWVAFQRRRRTFSEGHYHCLRQKTTPDGISPSACATPRVSVITAHSPNPTIQTHLESNSDHTLKFWVTTVSTSDELLAATTLRAQLFYSYRKQPDLRMDDRIESIKERVAHNFLVTDLLKSRIKSEYNRVIEWDATGVRWLQETKMQALGMRVRCLLAVCNQAELEAFLSSSGGAAWPSYLSPPSVNPQEPDSTKALVAIGTLDIQDGTGTKATADVNLVTFQLYSVAHAARQKQVDTANNMGGSYPIVQQCTLEQGYLFNLCVIQSARRRGVAKALMEAALQVAREMQLQILFVHVEADNLSALALYKGLGYVVEEEESIEVERVLNRPRRMLLSFWVS